MIFDGPTKQDLPLLTPGFYRLRIADVSDQLTVCFERNGRQIFADQVRMLHDLEHWPVEVTGPDPITALLDGPYTQVGIDCYFRLLEAMRDRGPIATPQQIACLLRDNVESGSLGVALLAVRCGLFSLLIAAEAMKQLAGPEQWRLDDAAGKAQFDQVNRALDAIDADMARVDRLLAKRRQERRSFRGNTVPVARAAPVRRRRGEAVQ